MLVSKADFLSLQVILMQKTTRRNYFFHWTSIANHSALFESFLPPIEAALRNFKKTSEYQRAVESMEYFPENFENILKTHAGIDKTLHRYLPYLKGINNEFHNHFIEKLLYLKPILIQNIVLDDTHGNALSILDAFDIIQAIQPELYTYFSRLPEANPAEELRYFAQILQESKKDDTQKLSVFLKAHPMVTVILINHIMPLERIRRERLFFLKVTLMQTLSINSYFFDWAKTSGYSDRIYSILSPLENELGESKTLSTNYKEALDALETHPEKLEIFLIKHYKINTILAAHADDLKEINEAFHTHCAEMLLPLRTMLIQSTEQDSDFEKWIKNSTFSDYIQKLSAELQAYFTKRSAQYSDNEGNDPFITTFVKALQSMQNNRSHLINFLKRNPSITLLFMNYIKILNIVNISFSKHLHSPSYENTHLLCKSEPVAFVPHFNLTQSEKGKKEEKEEEVLADGFSKITL